MARKYNIEDYIGKKFGHLTIISKEKFKDSRNRSMYLCQCDCGNTCYCYLHNLLSGDRIYCSLSCKMTKRDNPRNKGVIVRDIDGNEVERYNSLSECATHYKTFSAAVSYWIRKGEVFRGNTFHFAETPFNKNDYKPKKPFSHAQPKKETHELKYEVANKIICITPCPFMPTDNMGHRTKVGSSQCFMCKYFVRKDFKQRVVYCSFKIRKQS